MLFCNSIMIKSRWYDLNFFKKYKNYILAFLIPLFIYTLFFFIKGCFFENTMINADMQAQYLPLFEYLRDVLHGEADFPYTFSKGLGGGMYGTYFYYLSNPLNLLVYFFENVPLFLNILLLMTFLFPFFSIGKAIYAVSDPAHPEDRRLKG